MLVMLSNPAGLVVPLADLKAALNVYHDDKDEVLRAYVRAEAARYGDFTRRVMQPTDFEVRLTSWVSSVTLPVNPVRAVTEVVYLDTGDAEQPIAGDQWYLSATETQTVVHFIDDFSGPDLSDLDRPVRIRFSAGYDLPNSPVSGMPDFIAPHPSDQASITRMVGRLFYADEALTETAMRETMSGRRLLV